MTLKLSDRELERLLRGDDGAATRPPAGLLARLRADLPGELPLAPPVAETGPRPRPSRRRRQRCCGRCGGGGRCSRWRPAWR